MHNKRLTRRKLLQLAGLAGSLTGCSLIGNRAPPQPAAVQLASATPAPVAATATPTAAPARQAATAAPAASATSAPTAGPRQFDIDVLVIGAGMAGIAAARHLKANGISALTIEARTRLGGRMFTDTKVVPLDMGPGFIQGTPEPDFKRALDATGTELLPWKSSMLTLFESPQTPVSKADDDAARAVMTEIRRRMQDGLGKAHPSTALADEIALVARKASLSPQATAVLGAHIDAQITTVLGEDPERLSLRAYAPPATDIPLWYVQGGFGALATKLANPIDVRMGWRATRVLLEDEGAEVIGERRSLRARRIIMTIPLGSMQQNRIDFSPALPAAKPAAYGVMRMGTISKFGLRFNRKFWDTDLATFAVAHEEVTTHAVFWNWQPYIQQSILIAHCGGRLGRLLESLPQSDAVDVLMGQLRRAFGPGVPNPTDTFNVRWDSDPFSLGSHCVIPPGGTFDHVDECAKPVRNLIYFAGEHTVREGYGTLMGAWQSGIRAAGEAMASLK